VPTNKVNRQTTGLDGVTGEFKNEFVGYFVKLQSHLLGYSVTFHR